MWRVVAAPQIGGMFPPAPQPALHLSAHTSVQLLAQVFWQPVPQANEQAIAQVYVHPIEQLVSHP